MKIFYTLICVICLLNITSVHGELRAGAAKVDVTPTFLPVIRNGGFLEATDNKVNDPLNARCLVLDDRVTRFAIVVVDSCMLPIELCDEAKRMASEKTGIPVSCILISATHSHSAPSVMNYCLGTRADPRYRKFLPSKIANSIISANSKLKPAKAAWGRVDASEYTACRRWSFIRGKELTDPFGGKTVRANMHPGYRNINAVGPTGPDDPWLSFLSVQSLDGQPLAVLGNFSMHYFSGHNGISSDFAGAFSEGLADKLAKNNSQFVGVMSQGTSGDLWWGDYSLDKAQSWSMKTYVKQLVDLVAGRLTNHEYKTDIPLGFAESRIELFRRTPDAVRLKWSKALIKKMNGNRPTNRPEVYAEQVDWISKNPLEELVLQAVRIGDLGITAIPCEVYGLTGLKLKSASPFPLTFNISLANGASGYIPPIEQHVLGGYTTWPARTAGLEVNAEARIVEEVTRLLEQLYGKGRKIYVESNSSYSNAVLNAKPTAYWRLGEQSSSISSDSTGNGHHAIYKGGVGFHLPGFNHSNKNEAHNSRAVHFAGGRVEAIVPYAQSFTVQFWLWNGIIKTDELVNNQIADLNGLNLNLINTENYAQSKLIFEPEKIDMTGIKPRRWELVTLVVNSKGYELWINKDQQLKFKKGMLNSKKNEKMRFVFGGDSMGKVDFHGKLDEIAFFNRALTSKEIINLYNSSFH